MTSKKTKPTMTPAQFKKYRESIGFTQQQMGSLLGVTYQAVYNWELGFRKVPETTVRLIRLFVKFPQLLKEF